MSAIYQKRLSRLAGAYPGDLARRSRIGLEKETLRVSPEGGISQTPHPRVLGSALTHPYITTDYSEALLEFITPPFTDQGDALGFLRDIHRFVYNTVTDEMLWATSMPCVVPGDEGIPVARYGSSNAGIMKHVYRLGLGHRYGRLMQVIAGVHFNYSLPDDFWPVYQDLEGDNQPLQDFISERYFCLIRNLQRFGWLIPYLFGASPAVCKSFLAGLPTALPEFDDNTLFGPYATSLRMSDIGYTNSREKGTGLSVSYNSLPEYVASLTYAIDTPCPAYQRIGVVVDGKYRQLNANILQIENEYYSTTRPKQIPSGDEKPSLALARRGVRYVELRSLDVSAFDPLGVNETQLRFLEAFLVFCLLHESPAIDEKERQDIDYNQMTTASRGREPAVELRRGDRAEPLAVWAKEISWQMQGVCELLDRGSTDYPYGQALETQTPVINEPDLTPSARILATMRAEGETFFHFAKRMSQQHQQYFRTQPLDKEREAFFRQQATESFDQQQIWEADDEISFPEYLERYFAQS